MSFRVLQGNPCPDRIAPYIAVITAGSTVNSIYRGSDAASILHAHSKHTQAEIHRMYPSTSNPEGQSTHDGHKGGAFPGRPTDRAEWWMQGWDVNDGDVERVIAAAHRRGWEVFRPYPRGAEFHHLCFAVQPRPQNIGQRLRLNVIRARLPRR